MPAWLITLLTSVATNPAVDSSVMQLLEGVAKQFLAKIHLPGELQQDLNAVLANTEAAAGAVLANTPGAAAGAAATNPAAPVATKS